MADLDLRTLLARTERGDLWRSATNTIVRLLEPHVCDAPFRHALERLRHVAFPSAARVVALGWHGMNFYVEYRPEGEWITLAEHWNELHWRQRLQSLKRVCDLMPQWTQVAGQPVGVSVANVVVVETAKQWFPWLLPCPPIPKLPALRLLDCDASALRSLAPETVRGIGADARAQDAYALGALAWQALGAAMTDGSAPDRVEAQACGWLVTPRVTATAVEPFLQSFDGVTELVNLASRYTEVVPLARPATGAPLAAAAPVAFASTDPMTVARRLVDAGRPLDALAVIDWGLKTSGATSELFVLGVAVAEHVKDLPRAIAYLSGAIDCEPGNVMLRLKRGDLRWLVYRQAPPLPPNAADPDGDALLQDIELFRRLRTDVRASEAYVRKAFVYERRGNLAAAAEELCNATDAEQADIGAAFQYVDVLRRMKQSELFPVARAEALRRVDRMVKSSLMSETEAQSWRKRFDSLALS